MNELNRTDIEYFTETLEALLKDADEDTKRDMQNICNELIRGYNS